MKTPEEIADECLRCPVVFTGKMGWLDADDPAASLPLRERIAHAIREAVAAEREACRAAVAAIEPGLDWYYTEEQGSWPDEESARSCLDRAVKEIEARGNV